MGDMPWGAHLCVFFETKVDLLDTAATYFAAGLASNEFCMWVVSDPITAEDAKTLLRREIPDFDQHVALGRIEILNKITGRWSEKLNGALARGNEGMRVSGNARLFGFHGSVHAPLDHFSFESKHWEEFCEYEHELDRSLAGQKMIVLCTYSLQASRALAQIVRGASSKEAARALGIGPRTVEFHRENIMRKLSAKNTIDLVRRVLGE